MTGEVAVSAGTVISVLASALCGVCVFFVKKYLDKVERLDAEAVRKRELKELEERLAQVGWCWPTKSRRFDRAVWLAGTPYSCIRIERWGWRLWLGWKLKPSDRDGLPPGDVRAIRCDFACQLKRVAHG